MSSGVYRFRVGDVQAAASKTRILNLAADEQALDFAHHFPPFPNPGYVRRTDDHWRWEPVTEMETQDTNGDP
jgi:hypothetical protein